MSEERKIPVVSVICNTYNHGKYIRQCLDSLVEQETDFPYEILVHDDASTDDTADIVREYEGRYPDKILPICQKVNQYSQKIKISFTFQYPRVRGKYVAFCEGDDYWTDPHKLQKQYDLMERHPEVDICAHASIIVDAQSGNVIKTERRLDETGIIPAADVIRGGGRFVSTNTLFYRSEILKNMPEFRRMLDFDITMQAHGALRGGMLYMPDVMSAYRAHVQGSWVNRMSKDSKGKIAHLKRVRAMLGQMDRDTNHRFWKIILKRRIEMTARIFAFRIGIGKRKGL